MGKTIITIMAICLMSFSLAYYPGETVVFSNEMGIENLVYTIIGNSSPVSELIVDVNSTNITITFPQDMIPDSFDIVFLENQTREVVQIIYRGGGSSGGSRTKYVDKNVTVYIPIYKNITEIVEVEKIIDNTTVLKTGFELWHLGLLGLICLVFGGVVIYYWGKSDDTKT